MKIIDEIKSIKKNANKKGITIIDPINNKIFKKIYNLPYLY